MRFFVKDASYLSRIKKTKLRKLMWIGANHKTPLSKKITIEPFYRIVNDEMVIVAVRLFAQGNESDEADWKFKLHEQTYIKGSDWYKMFEPVVNYDNWYNAIMEKDHKRDLIASLIEAAIEYGQVKSNCANGLISDAEAAMAPKGKEVYEIRDALYKALGL